MDSYVFFAALVPLAFIGGIIALVVYLVRRSKNPKEVAPFDWRRFGVAVTTSFILPFFICFATSAVFNELIKTESLIMAIVMSVIFLIVGLAIAHHTVISGSLIVGSIIAIIYMVGLNIDTVPPAVMTILAGLGLAILIYFAYKKLQEKEIA